MKEKLKKIFTPKKLSDSSSSKATTPMQQLPPIQPASQPITQPQAVQEVEEDNSDQLKQILNNDGVYRYHQLIILSEIANHLKTANESLKGIGTVLISIGEILDEDDDGESEESEDDIDQDEEE